MVSAVPPRRRSSTWPAPTSPVDDMENPKGRSRTRLRLIHLSRFSTISRFWHRVFSIPSTFRPSRPRPLPARGIISARPAKSRRGQRIAAESASRGRCDRSRLAALRYERRCGGPTRASDPTQRQHVALSSGSAPIRSRAKDPIRHASSPYRPPGRWPPLLQLGKGRRLL